MLSDLKHRAAGATKGALLLLASVGLGSLWTGTAITASSALLAVPQVAVAGDDEQKQDVVLFRTGQQVQGQILEETPTTIRMRISVAGIAAETTYNKSEILSITRNAGDVTGAAEEAGRPEASRNAAARADASPGRSDRKKAYVINLTGLFGEEISETPVRQAVRDAQRHEVDYIIVVIDNDWSVRRQGVELELETPEDDTEFFLLSRAADIEPIFREEIPREWDNPPEIVFWVKSAMGGAAFLPLSTGSIYFHSEGRMGGVGHLERMGQNRGDEVVRQKMYSAFMNQAEGLAIAGGYDSRIVRAMVWTEYVLSVRFEGGQAVLVEGYPEDGGILLTDDGKDDRRDTIEALARGEGNDVLTLRADMAYKLGVSKGTADTLEDLFFELGLARNYQVVPGQADRIMRNWRDGVSSSKRTLRRLWTDLNRIQVAGEHSERRRARARQISLIEEMQSIIRRYEEAFDPRSVGVPDFNTLNIRKEQIRMEQMADRR